jgi:hypothetical protein
MNRVQRRTASLMPRRRKLTIARLLMELIPLKMEVLTNLLMTSMSLMTTSKTLSKQMTLKKVTNQMRK